MYIVDVLTKTKNGKISHKCTLLRESYRENGKVKNRTIKNLTHCDPRDVAAIRLALKYKDDLSVLKSMKEDVKIEQGMSVGAVWVVYDVARQLGIEKALGRGREGKLAMWQVIARVIEQGSRLSAVRLAGVHACCDVLGIEEGFNEEDLYKNLAWLKENQRAIEKRLFGERLKGKDVELFLYDVTSSYLEGEHNELGDWGYNRDGKKGKKQVIVGLLCDESGDPVSIEVFRGNTRDFETFGNQIKKVAEDFGCRRVTFVGDRGMIKSGQIRELKEEEFYYITAITKPEIEKLIKEGVFQIGLFDEEIYEVKDAGVRYVLRRNPQRAEEMRLNRIDKKRLIEKLCQEKNKYLSEHRRAKVETSIKCVRNKIKQLKTDRWLKVEVEGRVLSLKEDKEALEEESKLDGCYCIKSNLPDEIEKQIIHERYKDLTEVEEGFRTCKTGMLEMRPWYVWREESTRGHAFVVMLAYLVTRRLQRYWAGFNLTVKEGLNQLTTLCSMKISLREGGSCYRIPTPSESLGKLVESAKVRLVDALPHLGVKVVSRKRLQTRRKTP